MVQFITRDLKMSRLSLYVSDTLIGT
uniref:Uncharacterized protein n=1 Tax=Anguilla anguilla TaxID=7936 RepID=A0A0E9TUG7_ANGAN